MSFDQCHPLQHDLRHLRLRKRYNKEGITVIMPCYNEDPELLTRAVRSVVRARGVKHIVIVDDGSTNGVHETLRSVTASRHIQLHVLERNRGKRAALHAAITRCVRENPFVVVMYSDTKSLSCHIPQQRSVISTLKVY